MIQTPDDLLTALVTLFEAHGASEYLGEPVSMAAHMLQCAAQAERAGAAPALIVAALLHDIGHFTSDGPADAVAAGQDNDHETAGAAFLMGVFGPEVTEPIRLHVAAKRYLCATQPAYFERLSPASVGTLWLQGGPMSAEEVRDFEGHPHAAAAVRLRHWDETAKIPDAPTRTFTDYIPMIMDLARIKAAIASSP